MGTKSSIMSVSGAPVSRRGLILTAGAAGLAAAARPYGAFAAGAEATLKVGFISPRTGALGGFGETDGYVLEVVRKALASGLEGRRQDLRGRDPRPGHPVRSVARRPARQDADQLRQDRHDAGRLDAGDDQPGRRCLRGGGRAVPVDRHAVGGLVLRPRRQARPALAVQVDLSFRLRRRRVLQDLCLAMEPDRDQQEGRRALSQRRRRQRDPRRISRRRSPRPASPSSIRAPTRTARPTIRRRSPSSRRRSARSSTPSRSRPTSPPSGARRRSRATPRWSRSPRSPRPASSPRRSRRSARSASTSPAPPTGTRPSPTSRR